MRIQYRGSSPQDGGKPSSCGPRYRPRRERARFLRDFVAPLMSPYQKKQAPAASCQGGEICGARGCSGVPPPPMELGPLLLTTWSTVRIVSMS